VTKDDILVSKRGHFNEPRNVAMYLIRCIRNDTLKGVGKAFGIDKNSTVGSVVERVKREMEKNKNISKRVEKLEGYIRKELRVDLTTLSPITSFLKSRSGRILKV